MNDETVADLYAYEVPLVTVSGDRLRYGRMVKALACRVKGPGSNLTWEKFRKKFRKKKKKKKKKASYPLLA